MTALFAVVFAQGFSGAASATPYTSNPITHNFSGSYCSTCGTSFNDQSYTLFTDQSGWYNFGSSSNPLPGLLSSIDPNFDTLYQVDGITIHLHQMFAKSPFETWYLDIGSGQTGGGVAQSFLLGADSYQDFTLAPNDPAFSLALAGATGVFQFKFRETTSFADTFRAFNAQARVN